MQWNPDILRKFIAPGIDEFVSALIPDVQDMFPQAPYWLSNHFLNNFGRASFPDGMRQVTLNFIRRTQNAFNHYHRQGRLPTDISREMNLSIPSGLATLLQYPNGRNSPSRVRWPWICSSG